MTASESELTTTNSGREWGGGGGGGEREVRIIFPVKYFYNKFVRISISCVNGMSMYMLFNITAPANKHSN